MDVLLISLLDRFRGSIPDTRLSNKGSYSDIDLDSGYLSIRRDLENLLNTRCSILSPNISELIYQDTLVHYGVPDLATYNVVDNTHRRNFFREIEEIIIKFDKRFKSVKISAVENKDKSERTIKLRIEGVIQSNGSFEQLVFDSIIDPVGRDVSIKGGSYV